MINLIPNEEKKRMAKDFYFRLFVVFLWVLSVSILVAGVALLPSYFLSSLRKNFTSEKLAAEKAQPEPTLDPETASVIKDLDTKLGIVEKAEKNRYLISESIINQVIVSRMPDIKIEQISYRDDAALGKKITLRGIAPSRERLLLFRRALEDNVAFKKVDLPISNFTKGSNISFDLSLTPS